MQECNNNEEVRFLFGTGFRMTERLTIRIRLRIQTSSHPRTTFLSSSKLVEGQKHIEEWFLLAIRRVE